jgi:MFS family permease
MALMKFSELPRDARNLIIYYTLGSPSVVGFIIFNAYLFTLGFNVEYAGGIITLASLLSTAAIPLLGYLTDKGLNAKWLLIVMEALIGASFLMFGLAHTPVEFIAGRTFMSIATVFSFSLHVYEKEVYPSERLDDAYIWHWALPLAGQLVSCVVAELFLGVLFPNAEAIRIYYVLMALLTPLFVLYILKFLPDVRAPMRRKRRVKIPREFFPIVAAQMLVFAGISFYAGLTFDNIVMNHFGYGIFFIILAAIMESIFSLLATRTKSAVPERMKYRIFHLSLAVLAAHGFLNALLPGVLSGVSLFLFVFVSYGLMVWAYTTWHMYHMPLLLPTVPEELKGTLFSSISTVRRLLVIPIPFAVGLIANRVGPFAPSYVEGAFMLMALFLYWRVLSSRNIPDRKG